MIKINSHINIGRLFIISFLFVMICPVAQSQQLKNAKKMLAERGEIYVKFQKPSMLRMQTISDMVSIDNCKSNVGNNEIYAYLNERQFNQFQKLGVDFQLLQAPSMMAATRMCTDLNDLKSWSCYPTYDQYIEIMQSFVASYPDICSLVEFGQSVDGRKLLVLKISDNVGQTEEEPAFLYTSSMHGDEVTGYVLMLRLINYLLSSYNTDTRISNLINSCEIWINPLSNPDGTYSSGNSTVIGSTRSNSNLVDLNRNYPDPRGVQHPDGELLQPENKAMIDFMKIHQFTYAANFHGGTEVVNYPWDTWTSSQKKHADDAWYNEISREYADTVHANSTGGYMTDLDNGVTFGGDWYVVYGGRQDYMNYYLHGKETTIEISTTKIPDPSLLPKFWNYNYRSFLNYINRVNTGVYGKVTDQNGNPLRALISVKNHDFDSSEVYSNQTNGMYFRMLQSGNYTIAATCTGYDQLEQNTTIIKSAQTRLNFILQKQALKVDELKNDIIKNVKYNNPVNEILNLEFESEKNADCNISFFDLAGKRLKVIDKQISRGNNSEIINLENFKPGIYFCKINAGSFLFDIKFVKN